mgnify:CR=1 FL=1
MSDNKYNNVYNTIVARRGRNVAEALDEHRYYVSQMETRGENIAQASGGPGRGVYQYELATDGGSGAAKTAVQRYKNFYAHYNLEMPDEFKKELDSLDPNNPDFTTLSLGMQREIFLADKERGKLPADKLASGELSMEDAWLDYHWAGSAEEKENKRAYYRRETRPARRKLAEHKRRREFQAAQMERRKQARLEEAERLKQLTQVQSDEFAKDLVGRFDKFMNFMFGLEQRPNKPGDNNE